MGARCRVVYLPDAADGTQGRDSKLFMTVSSCSKNRILCFLYVLLKTFPVILNKEGIAKDGKQQLLLCLCMIKRCFCSRILLVQSTLSAPNAPMVPMLMSELMHLHKLCVLCCVLMHLHKKCVFLRRKGTRCSIIGPVFGVIGSYGSLRGSFAF